MFDYLIVGAGLAGSVLAERLASQPDKKVLAIDRRPHIGGNAYDHYDDDGLLIHQYGPHIFHREIESFIPYQKLIYTGPIDEFFHSCYGKLPYRSLDFEFQTMNTLVYQPVAVVNYPNDYAYTRVTEFKYLTGQEHPKTSLVYEHPRAEGDPYYPIPRAENTEVYKQYKVLAEATPDVHFVGRLATYTYYNMDQVVAQALSLFRKLSRQDLEQIQHELPSFSSAT